MPREMAERQLFAMVSAICHEDFYQVGMWSDETLGVYVGWVTIKNSFADAMPLRSERGDAVLVFSGTDFPDPATPRRLAERGHEFGRGASYLVHLYEENPNFIRELNGIFHGLLVDRNGRRAVLFNDRYGLHRLYYHEAEDAFYFAAEAKAILSAKPELRRINAEAMAEWTSCGCVLNNRTLFNDVHVLPPGSAWSFSVRRLERKDFYFQPCEWEELSVIDEESFYRELRDVFTSVLQRYFVSDQPIGMSMTGGLDTRMIMAWHKAKPGTLPCYTFAGPYRDCHDARIGRRVSETAGQQHQVIRVADEFLFQAPKYIERTVYLSEGCTSVINAKNLYVNECARQIAPIRMTGNYGGEVLRRLRMFKPIDPAPGLFQPELMMHIRKTRQTYSEMSQCHPLTFTVFRQIPWYHYGLRLLEETQITTHTPYLDNDLVRVAFRAPQSACKEQVCLRLMAEGNPELARIPTDRGLSVGGNAVLAKLSHQIHELTFKAEYAYDYGMPQWLARADHLLSPLHLERLFLGRHKYAHYRVWYRDVLAEFLRDVLLDSRSLSRSYLCANKVKQIVDNHTRGDRNYTWEIHSILTLELLHRSLIDLEPSPSDEPAMSLTRN